MSMEIVNNGEIVKSLNKKSKIYNDVLLEKALKTKSIQAVTHEGIIKIGNEFTKKREDFFKNEVQAFLDENDKVWKYIMDKDCQNIDEVAIKKQREAYEKKFKVMQIEINRFYENSLHDIESNMITETKEALKDVRIRTISQLNIEHNAIMEREKQKLTRQFDKSLREDSEHVKEMYNCLLSREKVHNELRLNQERAETNEVMKILQVRLKTILGNIEELTQDHLSETEEYCSLFSNTSSSHEHSNIDSPDSAINMIPDMLKELETFIKAYKQDNQGDERFITKFECMVISQMLEIMLETA